MQSRRRELSGRAGVAVIVLALVSALLTLVAPGAAAEPSMTVTPAVDVVDGSRVTVRGAGFTPGLEAASLLCSSAVADTEAAEDCDLGVNAQGTIAADGTIELLMQVRRFVTVRGDFIDCAVPDACMVVLVAGDLGNLTYDEAAGVPIVFDPRFPEPPPEVDISVDDVTAHVATVTAECSEQTDIDLTAALMQRRSQRPFVSRLRTQGRLRFRCNNSTTVQIPLLPKHATKPNGRRLFPMRSLRPGPATLTLTYRAVSGEFEWSDTVRRQVEIDDPTLSGRLTIDHPQVQVRLLDVRIAGDAVADVEVTCDGPSTVRVDARVLARIAPDTYRAAIATRSSVDCTGAPRQVELELNQTIHPRRDDIVPAGPVEVFVTAGRQSDETAAADFVPITTDRSIRPRSIRVRHHPRARIDIGAVTTRGVTATFRCKRDAPFTVVATLGQPIDTLVFNDRGTTVVSCIEGEAVAFETLWEGQIIRPDVRSAVAVRAINGYRPNWTGKFQQNQGVWRTVEAAT